MKKNDHFIGVCVDYTKEGFGVVKNEGFCFFVKGLLLHEEAELIITVLKKSYGYAHIHKITQVSKERVEPVCQIYKQCGGCHLQHMSASHQNSFKTNYVNQVFQRIGKMEVQVHPTHFMSDPYYYRNKVQLPIEKQRDKSVIGFYRFNSHDIVDCDFCWIQSKVANQIVQTIKTYLQTCSFVEDFRYLLIKQAFKTNQIMVVFIMRSWREKELGSLQNQLVEQFPMIKSVLIQLNKEEGNVILSNQEKLMYGNKVILDELGDFKFNISSKSFYQINPIQTEKLYAKAIELMNLKGNETLIDVYCGVGTIGIFASRHVHKVIGIEIVEEAIVDAEKNAEINHVENIEFICGDAGKCTQTLYQRNIQPDIVVVDPPRKGCDEATIQAISSMNPGKIVYISCDPATLARDCALLAQHDYEVNEVYPFDLFPQTYHVETVCLLSKLKSDHHIEVNLNMDELDLTSAESKATYEEIKEYVLENSGFKVSSLYIGQVKEKMGIKERENYNISKKEDAKVPKCPDDKEKAIMDALKHFSMIGGNING